MDELHRLSDRIASCDLPRVLSRDDARAAVANFSALSSIIEGSHLGNLRWLTVKVKAAADEHGIPMQISPEMADLYEGYLKDREIFSMPQPIQYFAIWARKLGLRKSFYEGPNRA